MFTVASKPRTRNSPLKADPTRTATLRRMMLADVRRRFRGLRTTIMQLLLQEDAFALKGASNPLPKILNERHLGRHHEKGGVREENLDISVHLGKLGDPIGGTAFSLPADRAMEEASRVYFNQRLGIVMAKGFSEPVLREISHIQSQIDSDDVLKWERTPHITVVYGFGRQHDPLDIKLALPDVPQWVKFGKIGVFHQEDQEVLHLEVESNMLRELNRTLLGLFKIPQKYQDYRPHLTLAYLRKGTAAKYLHSIANPLMSHTQSLETKFAQNIFDGLVNQRFRFLSTPEQVAAFQKWIAAQSKSRIVGVTAEQIEEAWWKQYTEEGYEKGMGRAFDDTRKPALAVDPNTGDVSDFYKGSKSEFLRSAFGRPVSVQKVKLLAGRVFTELSGVTEQMAQVMTRVLADGLVQGSNSRAIATELDKALGVGMRRAETIARTEIIRAHAEGQLDALEQLGIAEVGVMVEWDTAKDGRVCPKCQPLQGMVIKTQEARGLIPRHPNCRCAFLPANVGEDVTGQKRRKDQVQRAVKRSVAAERPKRKKRTIEEQRKRSPWAGAGLKIQPGNRPSPLIVKRSGKAFGILPVVKDNLNEEELKRFKFLIKHRNPLNKKVKAGTATPEEVKRAKEWNDEVTRLRDEAQRRAKGIGIDTPPPPPPPVVKPKPTPPPPVIKPS